MAPRPHLRHRPPPPLPLLRSGLSTSALLLLPSLSSGDPPSIPSTVSGDSFALPSTSGDPTALPSSTPGVSPAVLSTSPDSGSESALLRQLHRLVLRHSYPSPPSDLHPDFTIPSLSSALSVLSRPSPPLLHLLIRTCAAPRHSPPFPATLALFNWWLSTIPPSTPPPDPSPFLSMLDFAGKSHAFPVAWHLLDSMRRLGVPLTPLTFFPLIRRYARAARPAEAADAFARMELYGCSPDPAAFSSLIAALSKKRCAADAQAVFDRLRDRLPPDVVVYTALIHAWCRAYRIDEAERVFLEMKGAGVTPNVYTFTVVIDALCRAEQISRAQEVFVQMLDGGCTPNAATFNTLMRVHVKVGRTEKALEVYNQMRRMGCVPDVITYNSLVDAHCRDGNLDAALKVLNQMSIQGCAPNANSFNPVLGCILRLGDMGAARRIYARMKDAGCKPNTVTYNLLMELFRRSKSMDMVVKMKREMDEEGVEPNVNTYAVLVGLFCGVGNWNRAYRLIREMVDDKGLKPKGSMSQMVLECLRKAGQLKKHEELVEKLVARGFITRAI